MRAEKIRKILDSASSSISNNLTNDSQTTLIVNTNDTRILLLQISMIMNKKNGNNDTDL